MFEIFSPEFYDKIKQVIIILFHSPHEKRETMKVHRVNKKRDVDGGA